MQNRQFFKGLAVAITVLSLGNLAAFAQSVAPTSYDRAVPASSANEVTFGQRVAQIGDQVEQQVDARFHLETVSRRGDELFDQQATEMRRAQHRLITAAEIQNGRMTAAQLKYVSARKWSGVAGQGPSADALPNEPVEGKTYHCRREGERLIVTDNEGQTPPPAEYEIVALSMDMLGQPNLLAEFFAGRTMAVGEKVALPPEVADELLGLTKKLGTVVRFDLQLDDVADVDGVPCAVFAAMIEVEGAGSTQMRMQIDGTLVMQVNSCRLAKAELNGPLAMVESRGSLTTKYQLTSRGRLTIAIRSRYQSVDGYSSATQ